MKKRITLLMFIIILLTITFLSSCHPGTYMRATRSRGIERYQYNRRIWPAIETCATYDSQRPVKSSTMRRQQYHRYGRQ